MKIAIPSDSPGGLDAHVSSYFGQCEVFTIVDVEGESIQSVEVLPNFGHQPGGCMTPVMLLKNAKVDNISANGMGMRALFGFQQVGISVYSAADARNVQELVEMMIAGKCRKFKSAQVCDAGECVPG